MKIELEEPFKSLYKHGYARVSTKDKRKRVDLVNNSKDRTTISYARYLMCVSAGYILDDNLEVDHINCDESNDDISNLQILTKEQHREKTNREITTGRSGIHLVCSCCGIIFFRETRYLKRSKVYTACSRKCNGNLSRTISFSGKKKGRSV